MSNKTIKVTHIITGLNTGGAERALYNLLASDFSSKYDCSVISLIDDVYRTADKVFCFALGDMEDGMHFSNLFFPNADKVSQGASIFNNKRDIDLDESDNIIVCGCIPFAEMLKESLDARLGEGSYEVVIRINCEGSEDTGIYAFHKVFKDQFNVIFGSLKDVGELKGSTKMEALWTYIDSNNLKFVQFTPLYTTWRQASREFLDILR